MRKKIAMLAKGMIDQKLPEIRLLKTEIRETLLCGQSGKGEIRLESGSQMPFRGLLYADDDRIEIPDNAFGGTQAAVPFTVHGERIRKAEVLSGCFTLVTNAGERTVPYEFTFRQGIAGADSLPADREDLKKLWEESPETLTRLFTSGLLERAPLVAADPGKAALCRALRRSADPKGALEEFLTAFGIGRTVLLTVDTTTHYYKLKEGQDRAEIRLVRSGEGALSVQLSCSEDFMRVTRDKISARDFTGSEYRFPVIFSRKKLGAGKRQGTLTVDTGREQFRIPFEVRLEADGSREGTAVARRAAELDLEKTLIRLYSCADPPVMRAEVLTAFERFCALREESLTLRVLRAELLRKLEMRQEERELLGELRTEVQRARAREPVAYLWFLYLEALLGTSRDSVAGVSRLLARYEEEGGLDDPLLLLLKLRLGEFGQMTAEEILGKLRAYEAEGLMNSALRMEGCRVLSERPELLGGDDAFLRRLKLFGAKYGLWSREAALALAAETGAGKGFSTLDFRILTALYETTAEKAVLETLVRKLLAAGLMKPFYHRYYALGIEADLRLTQLYEYYLATLPEGYREPLPKMVLLYFSYNPPALLPARRALYGNILRTCPPDGRIYRLYETQMQNFALERLLAGEISEEMAGLYEKMFIPEVVEEKTAGILWEMLAMEHFRFPRTELASVAVQYRELAGEILVPVKDGEALVPLYRPDAAIVYVDRKGLRWRDVPAERRKLMNGAEGLREKCLELGKDLPLCFLQELEEVKKGRAVRDPQAFAGLLAAEDLSPAYRREILKSLFAPSSRRDDREAGALLRETVRQVPLEEGSAGCLIGQAARLEDLDTAFVLIGRFGFRDADGEDLLRLVSRKIRLLRYEYEELPFRASVWLYREGICGAVTLTYLCRFFNGGTAEMREILRAALQSRGLAYDMPERLLAQMLFCGITEDLEWVAGLYRAGTDRPDPMLENALAVVQSDRYFRGEISLTEQDIDALKTWALSEKRPEYLPAVCQMALTYRYSQEESLNEQDQALAEALVWQLYRKGLWFAYETKLGRFVNLPPELVDKTLIEYRGEPGGLPEIGLRILPKEEGRDYIYSEMPAVYRGIYVKALLLFAGETAEYRIRAGGRILEEGRVTREEGDRLSDSRFRKLNALLEGAEHAEDPDWQKQLVDYGREDVILKNTFGIL